MTQRYATCFKWITLALDYCLLNGALGLGLWGAQALLAEGASLALAHYQLNFLLLNLLWFYSASLVELYQDVLKREAVPTLVAALTALALCLAGLLVLAVTLPRYSLPLAFWGPALAFFAVLLLASKLGFLLLRKARRQVWMAPRPVIILGAGSAGLKLYRHLRANPELGYEVKGFFEDKLRGREFPLVLGGVEESLAYAIAHRIPEIYCALPLDQLDRIKALMRQAEHHLIRFRLVPDTNSLFDQNVMVELYGTVPVITPRQEALPDRNAENITLGTVHLAFAVLVRPWLNPLLRLSGKPLSRPAHLEDGFWPGRPGEPDQPAELQPRRQEALDAIIS